jgi:hypothetical protein
MAEAVLYGFLINQCWTLLIIFAALLSCNAVPGALLLHYHKSTVAQALTYSVTLTMHNFVLVEFSSRAEAGHSSAIEGGHKWGLASHGAGTRRW